MRSLFTLLSIFGLLSLSHGQNSIVKRTAKVHDDKKFVITEQIFKDGHKELFITSVPLSETKKMKPRSILGNLRNIEWDEDANKEGLQKKCRSKKDIENAFNNALTSLEIQLNLDLGSFAKIKLDKDFLTKDAETQALVVVNQVIRSMKHCPLFTELVELEGVTAELSEDSKKIATQILNGQDHKTDESAEKIGFRNIEFSEHFSNDALLLTNGNEEIQHPHLQAIYQWMFADAYTGWYNRSLLINQHKNNGSRGLNDDYNQEGTEGLIGIGMANGQLMNDVIEDPTFDSATAIVMQLIDPLASSKYQFKIKEVKTPFTSEVATRR